MKVNLGTIELSDDQRRAFRRWLSLPGLATRKDVAETARGYITAILELGAQIPPARQQAAELAPAPRPKRPDNVQPRPVCQETHDGITRCGREAIGMFGYRGRSEGPYPFCLEHADHTVSNRGGMTMWLFTSDPDVVARFPIVKCRHCARPAHDRVHTIGYKGAMSQHQFEPATLERGGWR